MKAKIILGLLAIVLGGFLFTQRAAGSNAGRTFSIKNRCAGLVDLYKGSKRIGRLSAGQTVEVVQKWYETQPVFVGIIHDGTNITGVFIDERSSLNQGSTSPGRVETIEIDQKNAETAGQKSGFFYGRFKRELLPADP